MKGPQPLHNVIRSGGVYGARSSRKAASYVIFCP